MGDGRKAQECILMYTYVYLWLIYHVIAEAKTTLYINYTPIKTKSFMATILEV